MVFRVRRPAVRAAVASSWLIASPALAQTVPPPAVANAAPVAVDTDAPLSDLPDIGVAWPDLGTAPDVSARDVAAIETDPVAETRYDWRLDGVEGVASALTRQRFADRSTLDANDGDPANAAQLDRRAREDADLLVTLLRAQGYYDARVATRIDPGPRPTVVLTAEPGTLYRFADVTLDGVADSGLRFGLRAGDPVDADAIVAGETALRTGAGREGFPFAQVGEPEIVVDRATQTATLTLAVTPGEVRRFGRVVALPGNRVFDADHVADIARFVPGDRYDAAVLDDLRRALIQTSLVSSAEVRPVEGSTPGTVDIGVRLDPAPPRTVAGELGYGTGEGARAELSWTHRNLFPPEGALTVRGVLGTREQLGSLVLRRSNAGGRDRVATFQVAAAHTERDAYEADTFLLSGTIERQSTIFFQKLWTWSAGAELLASDERDVDLASGNPRRRTYFIAALPGSIGYDASDDLLDPTRGFRIAGRISPELSLQGAVFGYARTQIDASGYTPLPGRVVLASRIRLGTIAGAPRAQIAPSRRFYAGGGASLRGYGFQSIGPRDVNNDPIGGRSLTEFSLEARVRVLGSFGVVPFLDAGTISTASVPRLSGLRYGTGLGLRYYSSFGPIRVDVGTPLNPRSGDARVAVYVSLGQAF
ncbi:MAG TPA: autotransporter assembly complex family protein [Sphingomonas sp.]